MFESVVIFKIHTFTCISFAGQPASQRAVRPCYIRCRALKITLNNGSLHSIHETAILKTIIPLHCGDSSNLSSILSSLSTDTYVYMQKQLMLLQYSMQDDNNSINMCLSFCMCRLIWLRLL